ncbi:MAG: peptidoglycan-associated lipoprotein Pal [Burkholderiales bacterium]
MTKILITLCIALSLVACATRKPAPISDANKAQVEEKSIGADGNDAGTQGAGGAAGGQSNQGAGGANEAGGRGDGRDSMNERGRNGADGTGGAGGAGANGVIPGKNTSGMLAQRSIYFDYDSSAVKDEFKAVVQAHAKFLVENPTAKVYLQGHTDERGSREYNLALGQKRADAVRRIMAVLGVKDGQIESVSYGEEKAKNAGHDEAAYAQNRRADIFYQGE